MFFALSKVLFLLLPFPLQSSATSNSSSSAGVWISDSRLSEILLQSNFSERLTKYLREKPLLRIATAWYCASCSAISAQISLANVTFLENGVKVLINAEAFMEKVGADQRRTKAVHLVANVSCLVEPEIREDRLFTIGTEENNKFGVLAFPSAGMEKRIQGGINNYVDSFINGVVVNGVPLPDSCGSPAALHVHRGRLVLEQKNGTEAVAIEECIRDTVDAVLAVETVELPE